MPREALSDDRDLIRAFLDGDAEAHRVLDGWIAAALNGSFRSIYCERDDLLQEARLRVLRNLKAGQFAGASGLRTYVHRIARNTAVDRMRIAYRLKRESISAAATLEWRAAPLRDQSASLIAGDLMNKVLAGLSASDRGLVAMIFEQQLSCAEVARRLGISEGAVKVRVLRCRDRLLKRRRELLGSEGVARP